jgi:hypothetical protein
MEKPKTSINSDAAPFLSRGVGGAWPSKAAASAPEGEDSTPLPPATQVRC